MLMKQIVQGDRSIRKFQQKPIPFEDLKEIMENVRYAHCGNNKQLLRYTVVTNKDLCDKIAKEVHYAALLQREFGQPKIEEEAVAYIILTKPINSTSIQDIDLGIAAEVITASAYEKGIASCMMLNFKEENIHSIIDIPSDYNARMIISMGYPAITSRIEEVKEDNTAYYLDKDHNYHVPKRKLEDLVIFK